MRSLALGCLALAVAGCAYLLPTPSPEPPPTLPPFVAVADTPEGIVGVARDVAGLHLWIYGSEVTHSLVQGDPPSVHLVSFSGETGQIYNSFVYGLAPPGAATVEIAAQPGSIGGQVTRGTFVIALRAKDVLPQQLNWTFKDGGGEVVARGSNITP